jgi:hypothetical protein
MNNLIYGLLSFVPPVVALSILCYFLNTWGFSITNLYSSLKNIFPSSEVLYIFVPLSVLYFATFLTLYFWNKRRGLSLFFLIVLGISLIASVYLFKQVATPAWG